MKRKTPDSPAVAKLLSILASSLLASVAIAARPPGAVTTATGTEFLSTDFAACAEPVPANPHPVPLSAAAFRTTLKGVWVATRILQQGSAPPADYVLILDLDAGEGIGYEDRGGNIQRNAFFDYFPPPGPEAPRIVYFYCGGPIYAPFKDVYVKVSGDPAQGAAALQEITGVAAASLSLADTWAAMVAEDYFTQPRGASILNASHYTVTVEDKNIGGNTAGARWDMVGEYRGTPERYVNGQPIMGLEGGFFEGSQDGLYLFGAGSPIQVACYGPAALKFDPAQLMPTVSYTKIVVGPLQP